MIDEDGTIMPINVWTYSITGDETCELYGNEDDGNVTNAYNRNILEDGSLEYEIPVYIKVGNKTYLVNALGGYYCLASMHELKSIKIPSNIKRIKQHAFDWCDSLSAVDLGDGVEILEYGVFRHCKSLESIVLPDSLTQIGHYCFDDCKNLKSIEIQNSVTSV